jgi:hypothetical protein
MKLSEAAEEDDLRHGLYKEHSNSVKAFSITMENIIIRYAGTIELQWLNNNLSDSSVFGGGAVISHTIYLLIGQRLSYCELSLEQHATFLFEILVPMFLFHRFRAKACAVP